jgi:hypothetical protein
VAAVTVTSLVEHRCAEFGIKSKKQPWILVCGCGVHVESGYSFQTVIDLFAAHVLGESLHVTAILRRAEAAEEDWQIAVAERDVLQAKVDSIPELIALFALHYVKDSDRVFGEPMARAFAAAIKEWSGAPAPEEQT